MVLPKDSGVWSALLPVEKEKLLIETFFSRSFFSTKQVALPYRDGFVYRILEGSGVDRRVFVEVRLNSIKEFE